MAERPASRLMLTADDVERVVKTIRVLTSPLDYAGETDWSRAVVDCLRETIGSELGGMILKHGDRSAMISTFGANAVADYMQRWFTTMPGDARRRAARITSWVRADVWSFEELQRGAYYHEWCLPNGNQDSAGMCVYQEDGSEVAAYVNTAKPGRFPRAGREAMLLSLLQPALAAGVATLGGLGRYRNDLRFLDSVGQPIGIFRADGKLLHAVPALAALLRDPVDGPLLLGAARKLVLLAGAATPELAVRTRKMRYTLYLGRVESALLGLERLFVVTVQRPRPRMDARALRDGFGLTAREAEVALLLARGCANDEIAQTLGLSPHTARRHTERVLHKLGVSSRAQVAARLEE